jgi:hypothetical protein
MEQSIRSRATWWTAGGALLALWVAGACGQVQRFGGEDDGGDPSGWPDEEDGTSSGSGQSSGVAPEDCVCKVQGDVCDSTTCVQPGYTCNALNPCGVGYDCAGEQCVCADELVCGIACADDDDCPSELACDVASGACRWPLSCFSEKNCEPGQVCLPDLAKNAAVCMAPGSKAAGQSCDVGQECASGLCATGICLVACKKTSDCPAGLTCSVVNPQVVEWAGDGTSEQGCTADSECGSCPADMVCILGECSRGCDTNADCAGETCVVNMQYVNECSPYAAGCGPDEAFVAGNDGIADHCIDNTICWTNDACAPPYTCVEVYDLNWEYAASMGGTAQVCARALPFDPEG